MRVHLLLLGGLAACHPGRGTVDARWLDQAEPLKIVTEGRAGWCPSSGMILVEATEEDRAAAVHWHFDSLGPSSHKLEVPTVPDSTVTGASAVLRYVHLDEVRGYRSLSGELTVESIDSSAVTGRLTAVLQRIGEADSTSLEMSFDRVPLVVDSTLCVAPKAAPDTLAPTPATVP
jgi:hypothetical protein